MSSDYDGQDQAYQDLLDENLGLIELNGLLRGQIQNIAELIYFQEDLKHQDRWLKIVMDEGIVCLHEEGDDE